MTGVSSLNPLSCPEPWFSHLLEEDSDSCHRDWGAIGQRAGAGGLQAGHLLVCILSLPRHRTQKLAPWYPEPLSTPLPSQ